MLDGNIIDVVSALQEENNNREAIKALVESMPDEKGLEFASKSIDLSGRELTPDEQEALDAVNNFIENPDNGLAAVEVPQSKLSMESPVASLAEAAKSASAGQTAQAQHFSTSTILMSSASPEAVSAATANSVIPTFGELQEPTPELLEQLEEQQQLMAELEEPVLEDELPQLPEELLDEAVAPEEQIGLLDDLEAPVDELLGEEGLPPADELEPFVELGLKIGDTIPGWG